MTTTYHAQSITTSFVGRVAQAVSPEARRLVALGEERGWEFTVLGQAPMLAEPVRLGDWLLVPIEQDSSLVPARALERVRAVFAAGLRPQGFVLVHEAPMLLPAPGANRPGVLRLPTLSPEVRATLKAAAGTLGAVAVGVGALAGLAALAVAVLSAAALLALPALLIAGVTLVDPILVAVTEDGYWVEIDRWSS